MNDELKKLLEDPEALKLAFLKLREQRRDWAQLCFETMYPTANEHQSGFVERWMKMDDEELVNAAKPKERSGAW